MRRFLTLSIIAVALFSVTSVAHATTMYYAVLSNLEQVPANASPATGLGSVELSDDLTTITVNFSWTGLLAPATAAHIHNAALGVNGPVVFPFSGVPSATSGAIPTQSFSIGSQLSNLQNGLLYFNIHDSGFPGGEIRGQIHLVPEPASGIAFAAMAVPFVGGLIRRRRLA